MESKCKNCGKEFSTYPSTHKIFCSKKCFYEWQRKKRIIVTCDNCNQSFETWSFKLKQNHNFCSISCRDEFKKKHPINPKKRIKLICNYCDKEFETIPSMKETKKFCSKECYTKWQDNKIEKICKNCGKIFRIRQGLKDAEFCSWECKTDYNQYSVECDYCKKPIIISKSEERDYKHHFCSMECKTRFQSEKLEPWNKGINIIEVTCDFCGKTLLKPLSKLKQSTTHFCSNNCYYKWKSKNLIGKNSPTWKYGAIRYRGNNWSVQRKKALERDNYFCQICGYSEKLDVHHIIPFRNFSNYIEANQLENLITLCHSCHMKYENNGILLVKEWQKNNKEGMEK